MFLFSLALSLDQHVKCLVHSYVYQLGNFAKLRAMGSSSSDRDGHDGDADAHLYLYLFIHLNFSFHLHWIAYKGLTMPPPSFRPRKGSCSNNSDFFTLTSSQIQNQKTVQNPKDDLFANIISREKQQIRNTGKAATSTFMFFSFQKKKTIKK